MTDVNEECNKVIKKKKIVEDQFFCPLEVCYNLHFC